jgi:phosphoribosylformylglycinamidine cyclo-ligase
MEDKGAGAAALSMTGPTRSSNPQNTRPDAYKQMGVDTAEADAGLISIVQRLEATWPTEGDGRDGRVLLRIGPDGYFANVLEIAGKGIALCTDGVGSKSIIAVMMDKYDTIGIDCVAMNVNDMICVGATPISMVDYIAVERADAAMLDQIGVGLFKGADLARI